MLLRPRVSTSAWVARIIPLDRSIPVTCPEGPTASANAKSAAPRPHPTSRARSPGCGASSATSPRAIGLNHSTPTASYVPATRSKTPATRRLCSEVSIGSVCRAARGRQTLASLRARLREDAGVRDGQYANRRQAGEVLAVDERLNRYASSDVVVLGLPRGGVPVAAPIAHALRAPLDIVVVRKLGTPGREELAMGAIASVGGSIRVVRNEHVANRVADSAFVEVYRRELIQLRAAEVTYRGLRAPLAVRGRVVVLVDDGLATGASMRAAVEAVLTQQPEQVVVAVPVGAAEACRQLDADEVICAWLPARFGAVGEAYVDFGQTTD